MHTRDRDFEATLRDAQQKKKTKTNNVKTPDGPIVIRYVFFILIG